MLLFQVKSPLYIALYTDCVKVALQCQTGKYLRGHMSDCAEDSSGSRGPVTMVVDSVLFLKLGNEMK